MRRIVLIAVLFFPVCSLTVFSLTGCSEESHENKQIPVTHVELRQLKPQQPVAKSVLASIRERGVLRVATRNAPTSYYLGPNGALGLEYDMVSDFALALGVALEFVVKDDVGGILRALRGGQADLAAAGLTHTRKREADFLFGPGYQYVRQQVVCRRGGRLARTVDELTEVSLAVVAESSYEEQLKELAKLVPGLTWATISDVSNEELLADVFNGHVDCTVADSNIVAVNRRYHPELLVMFDLTEPEELAWAMLPAAQDLHAAVEEWFEGYWSDGEVQRLLDVYYGHVEDFDYVDSRVLLRRLDSRLPVYRTLFEQAAEQYGFQWPLLAALAYQESHWDARATSTTGVKGLMMLTRDTAREMGVTDRTDPKQMIPAGARYLAQLRDRLPDSVAEPDRTWMALAAYNMGMSHLWDARILARTLGKDPDEWNSLMQVLPLLSQRQYYRTLNYGYARGYEALNYVQRIRNYYDMVATASESG